MPNILLSKTNFIDVAYIGPPFPALLDSNVTNQSDIVWQLPDNSVQIWDLRQPFFRIRTRELIDQDNSKFSPRDFTVRPPSIYTSPGPEWTSAGAGDFFHDGGSDLLWRHTDGYVHLWDLAVRIKPIFIGFEYQFAPPIGQVLTDQNGTMLQPGLEWTIVGACDLTGEGRTDILLRNWDQRLSFWAMNGAQADYTAGLVDLNGFEVKPNSSWTLCGTADFNRDNIDDLLWRHEDGTTVVWTMNANTVVASGQLLDSNGGLLAVGPDWTVAGIGDFDGDGSGDIVWRGPGNAVAMSFMQGSVVENWTAVLDQEFNPVLPGDEWSFAAIGDYNADGLSDILLRNTQNELSLWIMNGATLATSLGLYGGIGEGWDLIA